MTHIVDTDVCIAFLHRGEPSVVSKFAAAKPREFLLCSVVKAELNYGARHSQHVAANLDKLARFFAGFESLPFDDRAAEWYGTTRAVLASAGRPIGVNDLLIASIALANDVSVVTRNTREFSRVPGLRVTTW